jgi:anti-anti-sigma regulatory factor
MRYKIDTRTDFDIITPLYPNIDPILSEQLSDIVDQCSENGRSLILDCSIVEQIEKEVVLQWIRMHEEMYQHDLSFAICCLNASCKKQIADIEEDHVLNLTPTVEEAIDLVSMEGLERELMLGDDE